MIADNKMDTQLWDEMYRSHHTHDTMLRAQRLR